MIREEIPVPLPRPRSIESLTSDTAKDIERRIWRALMEEGGNHATSSLVPPGVEPGFARSVASRYVDASGHKCASGDHQDLS